MTLCKYSNILGEPNKGVHSYRIFNIAIVDVILTIILALFLTFIFKYSFKFKPNFVVIYVIILICLFILGIILHRLFCVRTTLDKLLFKN
jgi:hypothetical protein